MRWAPLAVGLAVLAALVPVAEARTTNLKTHSSAPQGVLSRGERIYVLAYNFLPRRICKKKVRFTLTDAAGKKYRLLRRRPSFKSRVEGELHGYVGDVPSTAAPGEGSLRSKQKCRAGRASGRVKTFIPGASNPQVAKLSANDGVSGLKTRFAFEITARARVAIRIDYEFMPGDWREVSVPLNGAYLTKPRLYAFDWRANVDGPVPAGHYRATVETRAYRRYYGEEPTVFHKKTEDFYIAERVGTGTLTEVVDGQVDGGGRLVVPDKVRNDIRVFGATGTLLATFAPPLSAPKDVAFSPDDSTIYVADSGNFRIAKVDRSGNMTGSFGSAGSGPGQFSSSQGPQGVAATAANGGRIYVVDGDNARIQAFDPNGELKSTITGGGLNDPFSPAIAPDGTIWVADAGSNKLLHFSPEGMTLGEIALPRPFGVDVDRAGRLIYADNQQRLAAVLDSGGVQSAVVGQSFLSGPSGVAAAGLAGDFYVLDGTADQVFRFRVP